MSDDPTELRGLKALLYRLEPTPGRQRPKHQRNGAITLGVLTLIVAVAMTVGYYRDIPFIGGGEKVRAEFGHITNLRVGNPVRVRGVKVGKVTGIERAPDGRAAIVSMELDDKHDVELKRDARAAIRWRTLLGRNMYLELDPGSAGAAPLDDRVIQRSHTESQIEFDQLFEPLDTTGRAGVQTMLREFDGAFDDPGLPGRNLDRLAPTMRRTAPALQALRGRRTGDMQRLVANTNRTMRSLASSEERLGRLIDGGAIALGVTAARRADLGSFVRQSPPTLRDTRTTMARLRTTLDLLDPIAERLRPGLRELDDASRRTRPALRAATPLLRDARPLATSLRTALRALAPAGREGERVIDGLDPTLTRLTTTLIPWLQDRNDLGIRNYQAIGPTISDIDSAAGQYTSLGHLMRFQGFAGGERSIGLPCATYFVEPKSPKRIQCEDFSKVFQGLFGGPGTRGSARKGGK
ncbi:MAG TPA: MlaD family protein [Baekduia sp.]|nr:MlaD family protein [Baekduia sp.]